MFSSIQFTKMQGVGNDFVLVQAPGGDIIDWPLIAIKLCDRHFGVGADGLLVLSPSELADVRMRMFNPDGSEDMCGNGLRCIARYAVEHGLAKVNLKAETLAGLRNASVKVVEGKVLIRVEMGQPLFSPKDIPMSLEADRVLDYPLRLANGSEIQIWALSTGSTHSVTFVEELPLDEEFFRISPEVENHPLFPQRTSLMWVKQAGENRLQIRIWERGAGETWGCGTGACAAAVAAILAGMAEGPVQVVSRGGSLTVDWNGAGSIYITGPAESVFTGICNME